MYVDGGVLDNLPVKPLLGKCDLLIGSFVNPAGQENTITGLVNIAVRTFLLSMAKEVEQKSKLFDIFVAPIELKDYGILDPENSRQLFNIGYKAMKKKLEENDVIKLIAGRLNS
jgi:NTE family protein